ncbi:MAG TPA: hypothetical protein VIZ87_06340 [Terrimicrobium sp.]
MRYYKYWGVEDIFTSITRRPTTRGQLWLNVQGLVDLRNKIAHGDYGAQATRSDVTRHMRGVRTFCERADASLARSIAVELKVLRPW